MKFLSIVAMVILIVMMNLTTPTEVGPTGVLVFFTTLYFLLFNVMTMGLSVLYRLMGRKGWRRKDDMYAAVGAFAPIMLLFMQSFGAVSGFSMALVVVFEVLAGFLVSRRF